MLTSEAPSDAQRKASEHDIPLSENVFLVPFAVETIGTLGPAPVELVEGAGWAADSDDLQGRTGDKRKTV